MAVQYHVPTLGVDLATSIENNRQREIDDMLEDFMTGIGQPSPHSNNFMDDL